MVKPRVSLFLFTVTFLLPVACVEPVLPEEDGGSPSGGASPGDAGVVAKGTAALDRCVRRGAPSVVCGDLVCSGVAPMCCVKRRGALGDEYLSCVDSLQNCNALSSEPYPADHVVCKCDDTADCPPGQICCRGTGQGPGRSEGARCAVSCDEIPGATQLCSKSCECAEGMSCSADGQCVP
jgi:hypothetical protein